MAERPLTLRESLQRHALRLLLRLPKGVQIWLTRKPSLRLDGDTLHPELQLILHLRDAVGTPRLCEGEPKATRARLRREAFVFAGARVPVGHVADLQIAGLSLRHYAPAANGGPRPLLVFFHGGGFVLCDLDTHDTACRRLCRRANIHVLSVNYRLAPEFPFPAAIEDACAALSWAMGNANSLGADPCRVAVGGDSAGANLAAVACQQRASQGAPAPALQLLLYPATDRTGSYSSLSLFGDGFLLTTRDIEWFQGLYAAGQDLGDPRISPLRARDLSGLPPAIVVTAAFDPLRDEGESYAAALERAGTRVVLMRMRGLTHGFLNLVDTSAACRTALDEVTDALKVQLEG